MMLILLYWIRVVAIVQWRCKTYVRGETVATALRSWPGGWSRPLLAQALFPLPTPHVRLGCVAGPQVCWTTTPCCIRIQR